jgi:hypothetical protein
VETLFYLSGYNFKGIPAKYPIDMEIAVQREDAIHMKRFGGNDQRSIG